MSDESGVATIRVSRHSAAPRSLAPRRKGDSCNGGMGEDAPTHISEFGQPQRPSKECNLPKFKAQEPHISRPKSFLDKSKSGGYNFLQDLGSNSEKLFDITPTRGGDLHYSDNQNTNLAWNDTSSMPLSEAISRIDIECFPQPVGLKQIQLSSVLSEFEFGNDKSTNSKEIPANVTGIKHRGFDFYPSATPSKLKQRARSEPAGSRKVLQFLQDGHVGQIIAEGPRDARLPKGSFDKKSPEPIVRPIQLMSDPDSSNILANVNETSDWGINLPGEICMSPLNESHDQRAAFEPGKKSKNRMKKCKHRSPVEMVKMTPMLTSNIDTILAQITSPDTQEGQPNREEQIKLRTLQESSFKFGDTGNSKHSIESSVDPPGHDKSPTTKVKCKSEKAGLGKTSPPTKRRSGGGGEGSPKSSVPCKDKDALRTPTTGPVQEPAERKKPQRRSKTCAIRLAGPCFRRRFSSCCRPSFNGGIFKSLAQAVGCQLKCIASMNQQFHNFPGMQGLYTPDIGCDSWYSNDGEQVYQIEHSPTGRNSSRLSSRRHGTPAFYNNRQQYVEPVRHRTARSSDTSNRTAFTNKRGSSASGRQSDGRELLRHDRQHALEGKRSVESDDKEYQVSRSSITSEGDPTQNSSQSTVPPEDHSLSQSKQSQATKSLGHRPSTETEISSSRDNDTEYADTLQHVVATSDEDVKVSEGRASGKRPDSEKSSERKTGRGYSDRNVGQKPVAKEGQGRHSASEKRLATGISDSSKDPRKETHIPVSRKRSSERDISQRKDLRESPSKNSMSERRSRQGSRESLRQFLAQSRETLEVSSPRHATEIRGHNRPSFVHLPQVKPVIDKWQHNADPCSDKASDTSRKNRATKESKQAGADSRRSSKTRLREKVQDDASQRQMRTDDDVLNQASAQEGQRQRHNRDVGDEGQNMEITVKYEPDSGKKCLSKSIHVTSPGNVVVVNMMDMKQDQRPRDRLALDDNCRKEIVSLLPTASELRQAEGYERCKGMLDSMKQSLLGPKERHTTSDCFGTKCVSDMCQSPASSSRGLYHSACDLSPRIRISQPIDEYTSLKPAFAGRYAYGRSNSGLLCKGSERALSGMEHCMSRRSDLSGDCESFDRCMSKCLDHPDEVMYETSDVDSINFIASEQEEAACDYGTRNANPGRELASKIGGVAKRPIFTSSSLDDRSGYEDLARITSRRARRGGQYESNDNSVSVKFSKHSSDFNSECPAVNPTANTCEEVRIKGLDKRPIQLQEPDVMRQSTDSPCISRSRSSIDLGERSDSRHSKDAFSNISTSRRRTNASPLSAKLLEDSRTDWHKNESSARGLRSEGLGYATRQRRGDELAQDVNGGGNDGESEDMATRFSKRTPRHGDIAQKQSASSVCSSARHEAEARHEHEDEFPETASTRSLMESSGADHDDHNDRKGQPERRLHASLASKPERTQRGTLWNETSTSVSEMRHIFLKTHPSPECVTRLRNESAKGALLHSPDSLASGASHGREQSLNESHERAREDQKSRSQRKKQIKILVDAGYEQTHSTSKANSLTEDSNGEDNSESTLDATTGDLESEYNEEEADEKTTLHKLAMKRNQKSFLRSELRLQRVLAESQDESHNSSCSRNAFVFRQGGEVGRNTSLKEKPQSDGKRKSCHMRPESLLSQNQPSFVECDQDAVDNFLFDSCAEGLCTLGGHAGGQGQQLVKVNQAASGSPNKYDPNRYTVTTPARLLNQTATPTRSPRFHWDRPQTIQLPGEDPQLHCSPSGQMRSRSNSASHGRRSRRFREGAIDQFEQIITPEQPLQICERRCMHAVKNGVPFYSNSLEASNECLGLSARSEPGAGSLRSSGDGRGRQDRSALATRSCTHGQPVAPTNKSSTTQHSTNQRNIGAPTHKNALVRLRDFLTGSGNQKCSRVSHHRRETHSTAGKVTRSDLAFSPTHVHRSSQEFQESKARLQRNPSGVGPITDQRRDGSDLSEAPSSHNLVPWGGNKNFSSSAQGGRNSPSAKGGRNSPSAKEGRNSPSVKGGRNSPSAKGGCNSPSAKGGRNSPSAEGDRNSPRAKGGRNSPSGAEGDRNSPRAKGGRNSPRAKGDRNSPRAKGGRNSPSGAEGDRNSPRAKGGRNSPRAKGDRNSPRAKGGRNSPSGAEGDRNSPRAKGGRNSPSGAEGDRNSSSGNGDSWYPEYAYRCGVIDTLRLLDTDFALPSPSLDMVPSYNQFENPCSRHTEPENRLACIMSTLPLLAVGANTDETFETIRQNSLQALLVAENLSLGWHNLTVYDQPAGQLETMVHHDKASSSYSNLSPNGDVHDQKNVSEQSQSKPARNNEIACCKKKKTKITRGNYSLSAGSPHLSKPEEIAGGDEWGCVSLLGRISDWVEGGNSSDSLENSDSTSTESDRLIGSQDTGNERPIGCQDKGNEKNQEPSTSLSECSHQSVVAPEGAANVGTQCNSELEIMKNGMKKRNLRNEEPFIDRKVESPNSNGVFVVEVPANQPKDASTCCNTVLYRTILSQTEENRLRVAISKKLCSSESLTLIPMALSESVPLVQVCSCRRSCVSPVKTPSASPRCCETGRDSFSATKRDDGAGEKMRDPSTGSTENTLTFYVIATEKQAKVSDENGPYPGREGCEGAAHSECKSKRYYVFTKEELLMAMTAPGGLDILRPLQRHSERTEIASASEKISGAGLQRQDDGCDGRVAEVDHELMDREERHCQAEGMDREERHCQTEETRLNNVEALTSAARRDGAISQECFQVKESLTKKHQVEGEKHQVEGEKHQVEGDKHQVEGKKHQVENEKQDVFKCTYLYEKDQNNDMRLRDEKDSEALGCHNNATNYCPVEDEQWQCIDAPNDALDKTRKPGSNRGTERRVEETNDDVDAESTRPRSKSRNSRTSSTQCDGHKHECDPRKEGVRQGHCRCGETPRTLSLPGECTERDKRRQPRDESSLHTGQSPERQPRRRVEPELTSSGESSAEQHIEADSREKMDEGVDEREELTNKTDTERRTAANLSHGSGSGDRKCRKKTLKARALLSSGPAPSKECGRSMSSSSLELTIQTLDRNSQSKRGGKQEVCRQHEAISVLETFVDDKLRVLIDNALKKLNIPNPKEFSNLARGRDSNERVPSRRHSSIYGSRACSSSLASRDKKSSPSASDSAIEAEKSVTEDIAIILSVQASEEERKKETSVELTKQQNETLLNWINSSVPECAKSAPKHSEQTDKYVVSVKRKRAVSELRKRRKKNNKTVVDTQSSDSQNITNSAQDCYYNIDNIAREALTSRSNCTRKGNIKRAKIRGSSHADAIHSPVYRFEPPPSPRQRCCSRNPRPHSERRQCPRKNVSAPLFSGTQKRTAASSGRGRNKKRSNHKISPKLKSSSARKISLAAEATTRGKSGNAAPPIPVAVKKSGETFTTSGISRIARSLDCFPELVCASDIYHEAVCNQMRGKNPCSVKSGLEKLKNHEKSNLRDQTWENDSLNDVEDLDACYLTPIKKESRLHVPMASGQSEPRFDVFVDRCRERLLEVTGAPSWTAGSTGLPYWPNESRGVPSRSHESRGLLNDARLSSLFQKSETSSGNEGSLEESDPSAIHRKCRTRTPLKSNCAQPGLNLHNLPDEPKRLNPQCREYFFSYLQYVNPFKSSFLRKEMHGFKPETFDRHDNRSKNEDELLKLYASGGQSNYFYRTKTAKITPWSTRRDNVNMSWRRSDSDLLPGEAFTPTRIPPDLSFQQWRMPGSPFDQVRAMSSVTSSMPTYASSYLNCKSSFASDTLDSFSLARVEKKFPRDDSHEFNSGSSKWYPMGSVASHQDLVWRNWNESANNGSDESSSNDASGNDELDLRESDQLGDFPRAGQHKGQGGQSGDQPSGCMDRPVGDKPRLSHMTHEQHLRRTPHASRDDGYCLCRERERACTSYDFVHLNYKVARVSNFAARNINGSGNMFGGGTVHSCEDHMSVLPEHGHESDEEFTSANEDFPLYSSNCNKRSKHLRKVSQEVDDTCNHPDSMSYYMGDGIAGQFDNFEGIPQEDLLISSSPVDDHGHVLYCSHRQKNLTCPRSSHDTGGQASAAGTKGGRNDCEVHGHVGAGHQLEASHVRSCFGQGDILNKRVFTQWFVDEADKGQQPQRRPAVGVAPNEKCSRRDLWITPSENCGSSGDDGEGDDDEDDDDAEGEDDDAEGDENEEEEEDGDENEDDDDEEDDDDDEDEDEEDEVDRVVPPQEASASHHVVQLNAGCLDHSKEKNAQNNYQHEKPQDMNESKMIAKGTSQAELFTKRPSRARTVAQSKIYGAGTKLSHQQSTGDHLNKQKQRAAHERNVHVKNSGAHQHKFTLEQIKVPAIEKERVRFACDENGDWAEIGRGSYGCVYLGLLDGVVEVAIKDFYESSSWDLVIHEARMLMFLQDTGITPKFYGLRRRFDVSKQPSEYCIVMEYFGDGRTLFNVMSDKMVLASDEWMDIVGQLVAGLRLIHRKNVLINDLKADNILIDLTGGRKIIRYIDVGMATYKQGLTFQLPQDQMSKYNFLAPEVREGARTTTRSDIFSLGYMLEQVCRMADSALGGLKKLVSRCMEKNPARRPDIDDIVSQVHRFIASKASIMVNSSSPPREQCVLTNSV